MKQSRSIMGMPISVEIIGQQVSNQDFEAVFDYFHYVDEKFSPFKETSEVSQINRGELPPEQHSRDMAEVLKLSGQTKQATNGYFDVVQEPIISICESLPPTRSGVEKGISGTGKMDPSGLVKGWAINNAANIIKTRGFQDFYVEAGGDIQTSGLNHDQSLWCIGIRNPFNLQENIKIVALSGQGIATSGTYERGNHVYNPHTGQPVTEIVSLTVIGPNIYEADRFATAAFAMGKKGIEFIQNLPNFEGYMIDQSGTATMTSGFGQYAR